MSIIQSSSEDDHTPDLHDFIAKLYVEKDAASSRLDAYRELWIEALDNVKRTLDNFKETDNNQMSEEILTRLLDFETQVTKYGKLYLLLIEQVQDLQEALEKQINKIMKKKPN